jgi:ubiquinone/menaquinone biosynthesis C-methylase UbiE
MKTDIIAEQKIFNEEIIEWKETISTPRYKYLVEKVREILREQGISDKRILELGCGISPYLGEMKAKEKWGLDISQELLNKNNPEDANFIKGNILRCSNLFDKKKFDFIFMVGVLHHINEEEHEIVIKEIKKLLKKDGRLLIIEPNMQSLTIVYYNLRKLIEKISKPLIKKIIGFSSEEEKYIYPKKLRKILLKNGFLLEKEYTFQTIRLPPLKFVKKVNIEKINEKMDNLIKNHGTVVVFLSKYISSLNMVKDY